MGYVREKQRTAFFKRRRRQPKERETMVGTWKDWIGEDMVAKHLQKTEAKGCMCDNNLNLSWIRIPSKPCLFLLLALQPFVA